MSEELFISSASAYEAGTVYKELGHGITCIDANYVQWGMACFYLIESNGEYAVIETGTNHSVENLTALLNHRKISFAQLRYIIPTHVHLDHAGGAGTMMTLFTQARLLVHPRGARHMVDPSRLVEGSKAVYGEEVFAELYGDIQAVAEDRILEMHDGDSVSFGSRTFTFRHTEGHARHHFCVWDDDSRGWFTGDMFGICYPWFRLDEGEHVIPSTTPTQFDPQAYMHSLEILCATEPEKMYLTHYGCVSFTREKAELLAAQVREYCAIASSGDEGTLEEALLEYSVGLIAEFSPGLDVEKIRNWLHFDMQLNAQGVGYWLQSESRER